MNDYGILKEQFQKKLNGLDFLKRTRKREYIEARAAFYYYLRTYEFRTYSQIQKVVQDLAGWKPNHASIMHSINSFDVYSYYNQELTALLQYVLYINDNPTNKPLFIKSVIQGCSDEVIDKVHYIVAEDYNEVRKMKLQQEKELQENLQN